MRMLRIAAIVMMMLAGAACARAEYVSVTELREQAETFGRWSQTYEAHGRTIAVDVPVIVPDVEQVPILQVKPVMGHEIIENLDLQKNEKNGAKNDYEDKAILPYLSGDDVSVEAATVSCFDPAEKDRAFFKCIIERLFLNGLAAIGRIPERFTIRMRLLQRQSLLRRMRFLWRMRRTR